MKCHHGAHVAHSTCLMHVCLHLQSHCWDFFFFFQPILLCVFLNFQSPCASAFRVVHALWPLQRSVFSSCSMLCLPCQQFFTFQSCCIFSWTLTLYEGQAGLCTDSEEDPILSWRLLGLVRGMNLTLLRAKARHINHILLLIFSESLAVQLRLASNLRSFCLNLSNAGNIGVHLTWLLVTSAGEECSSEVT